MISSTTIKFVILLLITAAISSTAFFLFARQLEGIEWAGAFVFGATITQLAAVWYFLSSLRTFKRGLRVAYYLLAAGILFYSILPASFALSVWTLILRSSVTITLIAYIAPYALGPLFAYLSMRKFARLLESRSRWNSFWLTFGTAAAVGAIVFFLPFPHDPTIDRTGLLELRTVYASIAWSGAFATIAAVLAIKIRRMIGAVYKNATLWLIAALSSLVFTAFHQVIASEYFATSNYVAYQFIAWTFLLVGVLFLRAGMAFKETGRESITLPATASYVDVVTATAQMASHPEAIDKELDKVRVITSHQDPSQGLSPADKSALLDTYIYLEQYLTTSEPLHTFTKEGLRNGLPEEFVQALSQQEKGIRVNQA